jgi:hypothetical protein
MSFHTDIAPKEDAAKTYQCDNQEDDSPFFYK